MYSDLLEWCLEIKGTSVMSDRYKFTPAYLRHTMWRLMAEVDKFYRQELMPEDFEKERGATPWPRSTKLLSVLEKFVDGEEIVSRSFPPEWTSAFYQKQGHDKKSPGGGRERSQWQPEAARGMPAFPPRTGAGAWGGGNNGWGVQPTASCHPAIKDLLMPYVSKFGTGDRIYLTLILN